MVHNQALLMAENAALRAENQHQKRKRARRNGFIQQGGSMTIQQGQQKAQQPSVAEQSSIQDENIDPAILTEQLFQPRKKAPPRCSKCSSFDHNARTCGL